MLRRNVLYKLPSLATVEQLDAFPKVHEEYTETTTTGGTVSILSFIIIVVLIYTETLYYSATNLRFEYDVDGDIDSKLKINIDITVAMPCHTIGADILDVTNQDTQTFGSLKEEPAYFELTGVQKVQWETMQSISQYIQEEYHAIQELMWKDGYASMLKSFPSHNKVQMGDPDSCRLHGSLVVNKVSGNFHITAGKHIAHPAGHAHLSAFLRDSDYNFSHRIERLSFGEPNIGIFYPLEGDMKTAQASYQVFQYYLKIVPTEVQSFGRYHTTYQYSVTEQERPINHNAGSHGVPGIYFKYDMSFVKVKVLVEHHHMWRFLVRLCGIVGGVFATSGALSIIVNFLVDTVLCKMVARQSFQIGNARPTRF